MNKYKDETPLGKQRSSGSRAAADESNNNMIPEEIEDCRNYIRLKFPGSFTGSWLDRQERIDKKRAVRDACVGVGFAPGLVQLAMRDPHYFYIDKVNTYPPTDQKPGWKTYSVVEKFRDPYGWSRRSLVWGENTEEEAYKMRSQGHFVGTKEEVLAILGPVHGEKPCGHLTHECRCEDGLIVGQMYAISRRGKLPLRAQYIRWNGKSIGYHEFRTLDGTEWVSVKSEDVKARVKHETGYREIKHGDWFKTEYFDGVRVETEGNAFTDQHEVCSRCNQKIVIRDGVLDRHHSTVDPKSPECVKPDEICLVCNKPNDAKHTMDHAPVTGERPHEKSGIKKKERKTWTDEQVWNWLKEKHPDVHALYKAEGFPRWIPLPKNLRPAGWHAMRPTPSVELSERIKSNCEYCQFHSSSRSCPLHGWSETRHDHFKRHDGHRIDDRYCNKCHTKPCTVVYVENKEKASCVNQTATTGQIREREY
jgi:hypothetical protein